VSNMYSNVSLSTLSNPVIINRGLENSVGSRSHRRTHEAAALPKRDTVISWTLLPIIGHLTAGIPGARPVNFGLKIFGGR
jgi:hypothetical protein